MIIVLKKNIPEENLEQIKSTLISNGMSFDVLTGVNYTLIPVAGDLTTSDMGRFKAMPGIHKIIRISKPYFMVSKEFCDKSVIDLGDGVKIGEGLSFISGPCSVEGPDSLDKIAKFLSSLGVKYFAEGHISSELPPILFRDLVNRV